MTRWSMQSITTKKESNLYDTIVFFFLEIKIYLVQEKYKAIHQGKNRSKTTEVREHKEENRREEQK